MRLRLDDGTMESSTLFHWTLEAVDSPHKSTQNPLQGPHLYHPLYDVICDFPGQTQTYSV